jgi:hypothetical protein
VSMRVPFFKRQPAYERRDTHHERDHQQPSHRPTL